MNTNVQLQNSFLQITFISLSFSQTYPSTLYSFHWQSLELRISFIKVIDWNKSKIHILIGCLNAPMFILYPVVVRDEYNTKHLVGSQDI